MNLNRLVRRLLDRESRTHDTTPPTTMEIAAGVTSETMELDEFLAYLDRLDAEGD